MEKTEDITNSSKTEEASTNNDGKPEEKINNDQINKEYNTSKIQLSSNVDGKKKVTLNVTFGAINRNNYNQLKQLNNMTLPVRYLNGFYYRIIHNMRLGRFAYYNDIIVGAITWKYDKYLDDEKNEQRNVYLMTISVLDEYRRYGIGSKLLEEIIRIHKNLKEVTYITLHVQISNLVALKFYEKHGFEKFKFLENYYTGAEVNPKDAYYLRYKIRND